MTRRQQTVWRMGLVGLVLLAVVMVGLMAANGCRFERPDPESRWARPNPTEFANPRCQVEYEFVAGLSSKHEDGYICDLYDRIRRLEQRIATLEQGP